MRWYTKIVAETKHGDTRKRTAFLFWPRKMINVVAVDWESSQVLEWRWLERASWTQRYSWKTLADKNEYQWKDEGWTSE